MKPENSAGDERVLVLAPTKRDCELSQSILAEAGLKFHLCGSFPEVVDQFYSGVGVVLLTEEMAEAEGASGLLGALENQPAWSDVPIVVLAEAGGDSPAAAWMMERFGNVTVLERPVRVTTLISSLRSAIRARRRQYQLRDQMDKLERSEQQLRLVIDALPVVVTYLDCEKRYRFVNHTLCKWFGLNTDDVINRPASEILGEKAFETIRPKMEQAIQGKRVRFEAELPYLHGGHRAVEVDYVPDIRPDGKVEGFVGLIHDVTERNRAAMALKESESRFRTLADNIMQFAWTADKLGWTTWYNKRWYDYTGTTWEEMKDRGWERLVHPEHIERVNQTLSDCLRSGTVWEDTFPIRGKDGQYRWFLSRSVPIRDDSGEIVRWFGTNTDVTDLRQAEESLRDRESRLSSLLALMPMAVYTCDAQGRINFFNRQAAELWGREPTIGVEDEKFCGSFRLWKPNGNRLPHAETPMAQAIRNGKSCRNQHVIIERPDSSRVTVSVNIDQLYDADGRRVGAINVFEDVTERVRAEEELKTADRRKDEFIALLAHELRNPLAPIRTGLQLIQLCGQDDPAMVSDTLGMMDRQVRHLVRLIDDLLDISRITQGKIELRPEACELGTILSIAIESSRPFIEEADVELTVSTPRQPVELTADPARLSQVVSNLLTNAAKYNNRRGHIWLTAEVHDSELQVIVRDDGIGIRPEMLTQIFEMFAQADTSSRRFGGLGIGLSLVRELVQLHGGTIEAKSEGKGKGSEFILRLPGIVGESQSVNRGPPASSELPAERYRVLVVDDNEDAAKTLRMMLMRTGNEVRTAHDGMEAIAAAAEYRPDLVLMDLGMPILDGYQAARQIRDTNWGKEMVLVALTGWGQEEDRQRTEQAGFDRHCVKPIGLDLLQQLLSEVPSLLQRTAT